MSLPLVLFEAKTFGMSRPKFSLQGTSREKKKKERKGMEEKWPFTKVFAGKLCSVFIIRAGCQHTNRNSVLQWEICPLQTSTFLMALLFFYSTLGINSGLCVGFFSGVFIRCCFLFQQKKKVIQLLDILYFKLYSIKILIWLKWWSTLYTKPEYSKPVF